MTIEEIRKGAPEGATHYDHEVKKYIKLNGDKLYFWYDDNGGWLSANIMFLDIERCSLL